MQEYYLRTDDMTVGYDKPLIAHIDLRLRRGEIMTLIGPNGAGKSTILKTIVRQLRLLGGVVELDGQSMAQLDARAVARKMSVLMTERHQPELMTCRDVAAAGRYPYTGRMGVLSKADWEKVDQALAQVRAAELADRPFSAVSDGQRQRVLLARALCQEPEILVLDEPTSFLDIRHKLELLTTLKDLVAERQLAVVLSLHELDLAQRVSDLVVCVHHNTIERVGPPEDVFTEDYIAALYELPRGVYSAAYGSLELPPVLGQPEVFVIGGGGSGIPAYRRLRRQGIPFAAGVLQENDLDYPAAQALAAQVIAAPAFHPIGEAAYARALAVLHGCARVLCCVPAFGPDNAANRRLLQAAQAQGKPVQFPEGVSPHGL